MNSVHPLEDNTSTKPKWHDLFQNLTSPKQKEKLVDLFSAGYQTLIGYLKPDCFS